MNSSKFFLSTLIAAAAMTAPAYAGEVLSWDFSWGDTLNLTLGSDGWTTAAASDKTKKDTKVNPNTYTPDVNIGNDPENTWTLTLTFTNNTSDTFVLDCISLEVFGFNGSGYFQASDTYNRPVGFTATTEASSHVSLGTDSISNTVDVTMPGGSSNGASKTLDLFLSDSASINAGETLSFTITAQSAQTVNNYGTFVGAKSVSLCSIDSLVWAGGKTGTWEGENSWVVSGTTTGETFVGRDSVTFDTENANIEVTGIVSPGSITVSENTTFSGKDYVVAPDGQITVGTGKTLTIDGTGTLKQSNISGTVKVGSQATIDLGDLTSAKTDYSSTISGDGTVSFNATPTNHSAGIKLGDAFTGTLIVSGNANLPRDSELGGTTKLVINNAYLWTEETATYTQDVEITGTATNLGGVGNSKQRGAGNITYKGDVVLTENSSFSFEQGTATFDGSFTGESGSTLHIGKSSGSANFNGTTNIASLNIEGGETTFAGTATIGGLSIVSGATVDVSGAMELTTAGGSDFDGKLEVLAGGTLTLTGHDALGFNGDGLDSGVISLQGDNSTKKANLVINDSNGDNNSMTLSKTLELKGYSTVSATEGRSFNSWNGKIKASGIENEISSAIGLRKELIVDVEDGGKLIISGNMSNGQAPVDGGLLKSGSGELTLSGNNNYSQGTTIEAGTLIAANANALGAGAVTISGGQLEVSEGVTVSNSLKVVLNPVGYGDLTTGYEVGSGKATIIGSGKIATGTSLEVCVDTELLTTIWNTGVTKQYQIFESSSLLDGEVTVSYTCDTAVDEDFWNAFYDAGGVLSFDQSSGVLTLGIPEPSAFGLLAGVGALALVVSRRKRRK